MNYFWKTSLCLLAPIVALGYIHGTCLGQPGGSQPIGSEPIDATTGLDSEYLVVSFVSEESEYFNAASRLADRHQARIIHANVDDIEELEKSLFQAQPKTVAFAIAPDDLHVNFVERILMISTRMDADPFVDFEYGFITGRNGQAATKLVDASSQKHHKAPAITLFGVGSKQMGKSRKQNTAWTLRNGKIPLKSLQATGDTDETRDSEFIKTSLSELDKAPILLLASHGYPNGLVGGLKAADIRGRDFGGSVALNVACYNGVTGSWYEDDWATMTIKKRNVDEEESFCLQMIDNGVAAYVAYVTPRPAGPTMFGDAMMVAASGNSLGELRKEDANSIILAHLLSGDESLTVEPFVDGQPLKAGRLPGDIVKRMSTGGVLIGDPAFKPFKEKPNSHPRVQSIEKTENGMIVSTTIKSLMFHLYTAEQINYWENKSPAMRLETIVPLGDKAVSAVRVLESPADQYQFAAAVEHDQGKRQLRFKITFPRGTDLRKFSFKGVSGEFEIEYSDNVADQTSDSKIFRGHKLAEK